MSINAKAGGSRYERFSDRARSAMQFAAEEARRFNHESIGTEHILLGLLKAGSGVAVTALINLGADPEDLRSAVERVLVRLPDVKRRRSHFGFFKTSGLPQTPRSKLVIEYSVDEARAFRDNCVGTEYLLLGLLREQEGVAAQVLTNFGLQLEPIRAEVGKLHKRTATS
jgi:ATP-dependent Clp protease ATP-binding subunit ClpC